MFIFYLDMHILGIYIYINRLFRYSSGMPFQSSKPRPWHLILRIARRTKTFLFISSSGKIRRRLSGRGRGLPGTVSTVEWSLLCVLLLHSLLGLCLHRSLRGPEKERNPWTKGSCCGNLIRLLGCDGSLGLNVCRLVNNFWKHPFR